MDKRSKPTQSKDKNHYKRTDKPVKYEKKRNPTEDHGCKCAKLKAENWTKMLQEAGLVTPSPSEHSNDSMSDEICLCNEATKKEKKESQSKSYSNEQPGCTQFKKASRDLTGN